MFIAVVPAYNEEKNIGPVIRGLFNHPSSSKDYAGQVVDKVVVVDDGSSDNTAKVAQEAGVVVLRHKLNRGQGAALETGQVWARAHGADYVLHFDADGQFDIADIKPALDKLKAENADILFGSRFLGVSSNIPWFKKKVIFPLARLFHRIFIGLDLTDTHNGFRILNKNALQVICIIHDRMAHATEIIALTKKNQLKYVEFPVKVVYREYGQGVGGAVPILRDLFLGRFIKKH